LFSILQAFVPDSRVLDLFAGSGALAFEALSRGANYAALAEQDRHALSAIRANSLALRYGDRTEIIPGNLWQPATAARIKKSGPFDLILADPPYDHGRDRELVEFCLPFLSSNGLLVLQGGPGLIQRLQPLPENCLVYDQRTYGKTDLIFFRPAATG
jgi:16S rRNA (guanine(966)-N(2))-methyltransferase RsmD